MSWSTALTAPAARVRQLTAFVTSVHATVSEALQLLEKAMYGGALPVTIRQKKLAKLFRQTLKLVEIGKSCSGKSFSLLKLAKAVQANLSAC